MSENSISKTARALDLIPFILEHQGITILELAEKFGVSEKQIYEDLNLLFCCGLPGYTPLELIDMQFEDGFVTVSEPQALDQPRKFSQAELVSILVALDILEGAPSQLDRDEIPSLKSKISSLLKGSTRPIAISENKTPTLQEIESALRQGSAIEIEYISAKSDEITSRQIAPISLVAAGSQYFLTAWCSLAQAERTFRVDRIRKVSILHSTKFQTKKAKDHIQDEVMQYRLHVRSKGLRFIEENSHLIKETRRVGDGFEIVLSGVQEDWLLRTLRTYLGEIEVIAPDATAAALKERFRRTLNRYK